MNPILKESKLTVFMLLQWLREDQIISAKDYKNCKNYGKHISSKHPLNLIADCDIRHQKNANQIMTLELLSQWLAKKVKLPYFHIDPLKIDVASITTLCSLSYAQNYNILPIKVTEDDVIIATAEPYIRHWEADFDDRQTGAIKRVIANPDAIKRYSLEFYAFAKSLKGAEVSAANKVQSTIQNFEQLLELGESKNLDANHQHIVNLVSWLLQYAFDQRASDIHIEPRRDQGNVRFRIDGLLHSVYKLPSTVMSAVMSRFKILGRMNIAEKRLPQDGRIKTKTQANKEIELRLSTMPTAFGEKLVMRIFDPEVLLRDYRQLGFSQREQKIWTTMSRKLHGIILVTGPTGSGKTTTLYSTLKHLATPEINLCTVEDPIEQIEPSFNQMQVQANIGLNFASGIRALMRQDPDIIMIGEIRDSETADMAIQASLTGHLVFSTLHTNNAPSAISRLLNIGAPTYLIQQTLLGIMAQRLLRLLCAHCKKPHPLKDEQWHELTKPFSFNKPTHIYQANGCVECRQTGYSGRVGIYEILENTVGLRKLIINDCETHALQKQAIKDGMRPLRLSAVEKLGEGLTSLDEILRVTPEMMML